MAHLDLEENLEAAKRLAGKAIDTITTKLDGLKAKRILIGVGSVSKGKKTTGRIHRHGNQWHLKMGFDHIQSRIVGGLAEIALGFKMIELYGEVVINWTIYLGRIKDYGYNTSCQLYYLAELTDDSIKKIEIKNQDEDQSEDQDELDEDCIELDSKEYDQFANYEQASYIDHEINYGQEIELDDEIEDDELMEMIQFDPNDEDDYEMGESSKCDI